MKPRPQPAVARPQPILAVVELLGKRPVVLKGLSETGGELPGSLRQLVGHLVPSCSFESRSASIS